MTREAGETQCLAVRGHQPEEDAWRERALSPLPPSPSATRAGLGSFVDVGMTLEALQPLVHAGRHERLAGTTEVRDGSQIQHEVVAVVGNEHELTDRITRSEQSLALVESKPSLLHGTRAIRASHLQPSLSGFSATDADPIQAHEATGSNQVRCSPSSPVMVPEVDRFDVQVPPPRAVHAAGV